MDKLRLLLVEDDPLIAMLVEDALAEAGYDVTIVAGGSQAITELDANARRFRGVVTDVRLRDDILGWQVGQRARELVPAMPVVFVSGDSAGEWATKGVPDSIMIGKPFALSQLVTAISQLIDARPACPGQCCP